MWEWGEAGREGGDGEMWGVGLPQVPCGPETRDPAAARVEVRVGPGGGTTHGEFTFLCVLYNAVDVSIS